MKNQHILPCLVMLAYIPICQSTEWSLTSTLNPSVEYDDNILLNEDEQSSLHYAVTPTIFVNREVENMVLGLSAGYQIDRYSSLSSDNNTETPFILFNGSFNTERGEYGLTANYREATSRSTAIEDTGDFSTQSINRTRSISPSFSYQWTERDSLSLGGSYSERLSSITRFSDTETKLATVGWQHQFSERLSAGLTGTVSNYESEFQAVSTDDDNYNLSTNFAYKWSELWSFTGNLGARKLNNKSVSAGGGGKVEGSSTGSTFGISVTRAGDINTYSVDLSRDLTASNTGGVNENSRISTSWEYHISEQLTANVLAGYQEAISALEGASEKRENINFSSSLRWQFEKNLSLKVTYKYRKQIQEIEGTADSNAVSVILHYDWDGIRVSR